jgi:hypothetical protein
VLRRIAIENFKGIGESCAMAGDVAGRLWCFPPRRDGVARSKHERMSTRRLAEVTAEQLLGDARSSRAS